MITNELISYIQQAHDSGASKSETVSILKKQGWKSEDIEEAYKKALSSPKIPVSDMPHDTVLLDPGSLMQQAWDLAKKRFWNILGVIAVGWVVITAAFLVLVLLLVGVIVGGISAGVSGTGMSTLIIVGITLGVLIIVGCVVLGVWVQASLMTMALGYKEKLGVFNAYKKSWKRIGSYYLAAILSGFAVLGGYFAFIIPGIMVSVWLFPALYVVLSEGKGGFESLVLARNYVRGRFWDVLGRLAVLWAIQMGASLILYIISLLVGEDLSDIVYNILSWIFSILFIPFSLMYLVRLYESLKGSYQPAVGGSGGKGPILTFIILGVVLPVVVIALAIAAISKVPPEMYEYFIDNFKEGYSGGVTEDDTMLPPYYE